MKGVSEHDVRTIIELYIKGKIPLVPNSILVVQNTLVFLFHVFFQCLRTAHRALLVSSGADLECDPFSQSCSLCLLSLCQSGHTFWNTCLFVSVLSKVCVLPCSLLQLRAPWVGSLLTGSWTRRSCILWVCVQGLHVCRHCLEFRWPL